MNVYKTTTLLVSCQMEFQAAGGKNYTINTHTSPQTVLNTCDMKVCGLFRVTA